MRQRQQEVIVCFASFSFIMLFTHQAAAQFGNIVHFDASAYQPTFRNSHQHLKDKERDSVSVMLNLQQSFTAVGQRFIGVTIDISLARTGMKTFNFSSSKVQTLARAMTPCFFRFGGTSADCMTFEPSLHFVEGIYQDREHANDDLTKYVPDYSNFTMLATVWDKLNTFVQSVGWDFIMDLNALHRNPDGSWDPTNAVQLLQYSAARNYSIAGFELGNEYDLYKLGLKYNLTASQLAKDVQVLQQLLSRFPLYSSSFIIGPETAGLNPEYFMRFLYEGGENVVKASSTHFYYFNGNTADVGLFTSIPVMERLRPYLQSAFSQTRAVSESLPVWLSETSSAYNSGAPNISDRFVAGFLWLDKLGLSAEFGVETVLRQTFFYLNYALIDHNFNPNPDFWLTLLFKQLILGPVFTANGRDDIRVYAACGNVERFSPGALVVYLLNPNNYSVSFDLPQFPDQQLFLYILTPGDEDGLLSKFSALNGVKLEMRGDALPPLNPVSQHSGPVMLPSFSFGFVVVPSARVTLCIDRT